MITVAESVLGNVALSSVTVNVALVRVMEISESVMAETSMCSSKVKVSVRSIATRFGVLSVSVGGVLSGIMVSAPLIKPANVLPLISWIAVAEMLICKGVLLPVYSVVMDCICGSVSVIVRVFESDVGRVAPVSVTEFPPVLLVMVICVRLVADTSMASLNVRVSVDASRTRSGVVSVRVGGMVSLVVSSAVAVRPAK